MRLEVTTSLILSQHKLNYKFPMLSHMEETDNYISLTPRTCLAYISRQSTKPSFCFTTTQERTEAITFELV